MAIRDEISASMHDKVLVKIVYRRIRDNAVNDYTIEPYSFRRGPSGVALFGFDVEDDTIKRFVMARIRFAESIPDEEFSPRWRVEI